VERGEGPIGRIRQVREPKIALDMHRGRRRAIRCRAWRNESLPEPGGLGGLVDDQSDRASQKGRLLSTHPYGGRARARTSDRLIKRFFDSTDNQWLTCRTPSVFWAKTAAFAQFVARSYSGSDRSLFSQSHARHFGKVYFIISCRECQEPMSLQRNKSRRGIGTNALLPHNFLNFVKNFKFFASEHVGTLPVARPYIQSEFV
jgi:hypothetical protein